MNVTPLLLFFSRVEMVNNEEFDSKVKYPFQLIFFKDDRKFEKSCRSLKNHFSTPKRFGVRK
jgi:hypothetical protein